MRMKYLYTGLLLASVLAVSARTWTSSDGERTFEGELQEFDKSSGKVTVEVSGRTIAFQVDKLSEADAAYLAEWEPPVVETKADASSIEETLEGQKVGKVLTKRVLSKLDGEKFKSATLEKAPKYYLLYFSASW